MDTKEKIENLHAVWTETVEPAEFGREFELITETLEVLQGLPPIYDSFKTVSTRAALGSESADWNTLRQAAIMALGSVLKKYEERAAKRRTGNFRPFSIYCKFQNYLSHFLQNYLSHLTAPKFSRSSTA